MNRFTPMMVSPQSCQAIHSLGERGGVSPLVLPLVSHDYRTDDEEYALMNHPAHAGRSPHVRTGATLVEVLMALLIMAVGVTSVFTLFPLSILKAIQANHLTNAKLYEGAIKDTLLTHPQLWTGAPEWRENTLYGTQADTAQTQDLWVTPKSSGRLLPDTNQMFYCPGATSGTSGTRGPQFQTRTNWNATLSRGGYMNKYGQAAAGGFPSTVAAPLWQQDAYDGLLSWTPYRHSQYLANPLWSAYVVDPLGWHRNNFGAIAPAQAQFGQVISGDTSGSSIYLDRIHCQLGAAAAQGAFGLADSWNVVLESTPVVTSIPSANRVQIAFPDTVDLTQQGALDRIRIVLTSTLSPQVISLLVQASSTDPLPAYSAVAGYSVIEVNGVLPAGVVFEQARIEVQTPSRYSWLMSVHSGPRGEFDAQCAVVFNRSFETIDEQGYRAEFCRSEDLDGDGAIDAGEDTMLPNGRLDTNIAKVRWPYNVDADPPRIKEGGYIFDASLGYWYKIQKIEKINDEEQQRVNATDALAPAGAFVRTILTLSEQVKLNTGSSADAAPFTDYLIDGTNDCQAVLLPGVIHVFTPDLPQ